MYGSTFRIDGNCGKAISLVTGRDWLVTHVNRVVKFYWIPGHSAKTRRCQNISFWNSQLQNYKLEYSKLFSHVTETVLIDVTHDNAVDTQVRFACVKHFCLRNIQIS